MNKRMIIYMLGRIALVEAVLLILPLVCALIYKETTIIAFLITIGIAVTFGYLCSVLKPKNKTIYAREGFVIVALAWILMSALGALPFYLSREIPHYYDAFFETVSGFTTTGASILNNVEALSKGMLFWRSFSHWIGGMGVLVLVMAIIPTETGRSIHIMRAEMPGPIVGKLVPKIKSTAKILYLIYIVLTAVQVILLLCGEMNLFESLVYSFGTAGTGGFSVYADSLTGYNAYTQWVITVFMLIFGVNFNLYYLIIIKKLRTAIKSEELWWYIGIVAVSAALITYNIYPLYENLSNSLRHSMFQVATIISTTGYATADFNMWPSLSKAILFILMFVGACAGSTAGGLKVSRIVLLFKSVRANLKRMLHPRSVDSVRLEGKRIDAPTVTNVTVYLAIYFICFTVIFLLISFENFDFETNISAVAACFNNVGPGFGKVGPMGNFDIYTPFSKLVLSFAMLLGRLEIMPLILLFSPSVWLAKAFKLKTVLKGGFSNRNHKC